MDLEKFSSLLVAACYLDYVTSFHYSWLLLLLEMEM